MFRPANVCLSQFPSPNFLRNFPKEEQAATGIVCNSIPYVPVPVYHNTQHIHLPALYFDSLSGQYIQQEQITLEGMKLIQRGWTMQYGFVRWWLGSWQGRLGISKYSQHCSCWSSPACTQSGLGSACLEKLIKSEDSSWQKARRVLRERVAVNFFISNQNIIN